MAVVCESEKDDGNNEVHSLSVGNFREQAAKNFKCESGEVCY